MKLFKGNTDKLNDQELLWEFFVSRDQALLAIVYKRFVSLIYGTCLKYLGDRESSKDAVMEIFEKFCEIKDPGEIRSAKSWLYVVTKNHCLMKIRKENLENNRVLNMEFETSTHPDNDDEQDFDDLQKLNQCIERLTPGQKDCVKLFFVEELSYQQIVEMTKYDVKQVKSNIQNGKRNLKICMEEK